MLDEPLQIEFIFRSFMASLCNSRFWGLRPSNACSGSLRGQNEMPALMTSWISHLRPITKPSNLRVGLGFDYYHYSLRLTPVNSTTRPFLDGMNRKKSPLKYQHVKALLGLQRPSHRRVAYPGLFFRFSMPNSDAILVSSPNSS